MRFIWRSPFATFSHASFFSFWHSSALEYTIAQAGERGGTVRYISGERNHTRVSSTGLEQLANNIMQLSVSGGRNQGGCVNGQ